MPKLAKHITVRRVGSTATLVIDGEEFPYYLARDSITTDTHPDEFGRVTVTLVAERIDVHDDPRQTIDIACIDGLLPAAPQKVAILAHTVETAVNVWRAAQVALGTSVRQVFHSNGRHTMVLDNGTEVFPTTPVRARGSAADIVLIVADGTGIADLDDTAHALAVTSSRPRIVNVTP
jgi:hypothetical protein